MTKITPLKSLKLVNFRNYDNYEVVFKPVTVFYGPNGIGKSNIIEAISYISYAKSYRTRSDLSAIKNEKDYGQIIAKLGNNELNFVINKLTGKTKKEARYNKQDIKLTDLMGKLKVVIFTPETINIITGSPSERRRFLDMILSVTEKDYVLNLIKYKKVLKQRNQLLKTIKTPIANSQQLDFWNKEFVELSKKIIGKRKKLVSFLNNFINNEYKKIRGTAKTKNIDLKYRSSVRDLSRFEDLINASIDKEIILQKSLYGPHLDDIIINVNRVNVNQICSRGEIRSIAICLKKMEVDYIERKTLDKKVILLLDDVFSELDENRRKSVINLIKDRQSIITTTDKNFIGDIDKKDLKLVNLKNR